MASSIVVLRDGRVVEQGTTDQIFDQPSDPYTQALISAAMDLEVDSEQEHFIAE